MQTGKTRADHQHLLAKELLQKIKKNAGFIKQRLLQKNIDYYDICQEGRNVILHEVIEQFKETEEGELLFESLTGQIREQVDQVSTSIVKRQGYLIDCFRQATAFPLVKHREKPSFSLKILHGKNIKKELRRVIWSRMFNIDRYRMAFSKWDREVTPYKIKEELKVSLEKASMSQKMNLRENQVETSVRILEYFLKEQGRLPQKYHLYLTLLLIELYSSIKVERVMELGAVALGVADLLEYYNEDTESKINHIQKVLEIIDVESYNFVQQKYLSGPDADKAERQLLEGFQMFRLTAGSLYLPLQASQFLVDQLIIRRKCKLDIYAMFSIMILILSDELEEQYPKGKSLRQIFAMARDVIQKDEFVEAYNGIYQDVSPWFSGDDIAKHPHNKLLALMVTFQRDSAEERSEDDEDFLVDLEKKARMGKRT